MVNMVVIHITNKSLIPRIYLKTAIQQETHKQNRKIDKCHVSIWPINMKKVFNLSSNQKIKIMIKLKYYTYDFGKH